MPNTRKLEVLPEIATFDDATLLYGEVADYTGLASARKVPGSKLDDRYLLESNNLSDLTDASVARTNLGLGTISTINDAASDGFAYGRLNAAWAKVGGLALANTWTAAQRMEDGLTLAKVVSNDSGKLIISNTSNSAFARTKIQLTNDVTDTSITLYPSTHATLPNMMLYGGGTVAALTWQLQGNNIFSVVAGDDIAIGRSTSALVPLAKLHILGHQDQIQFVVQGNSSQTTNLQEWQDSSANVLAFIGPGGRPTFKPSTATTNAVLNVATIGANVTGAGVGAAGFGPGLLFTGESTTTVDRNMAQIAAVWSTATDATRTSYLSFSTVNSAAALAETVRIAPSLVTVNAAQYINTNSTTALLVERDGVNDNLLIVDTTNRFVGIGCVPAYTAHVCSTVGLSGATAANTANTFVIDSASSSGLSFLAPNVSVSRFFFGCPNDNDYAGFETYGPTHASTPGLFVLRASGNDRIAISSTGDVAIATNFTTPATRLHVIGKTTTNNAILNVITAGSEVTAAGVGAAGFGPGLLFTGESSTTVDTSMGRMYLKWNDATHATRKAWGALTAYDTAERTAIGWGASGTAPMCGFFNIATTPVVQPAAVADATGAGDVVAQLNALLARIRSLGLIAT